MKVTAQTVLLSGLGKGDVNRRCNAGVGETFTIQTGQNIHAFQRYVFVNRQASFCW